MKDVDVSVRPSTTAYLIFEIPIAFVFSIFYFSYARNGYDIWPVVLGFSLFMALVAFILWNNRICLKGNILVFRGIWGRKFFQISLISIIIYFRSWSDHRGRGLTSLVGFYLELHPKGQQGLVFSKNIKVFDRGQLVRFLRAMRDRGVPIQIDQTSAHFLGLRTSEFFA